jgi:hypothetical protein
MKNPKYFAALALVIAECLASPFARAQSSLTWNSTATTGTGTEWSNTPSNFTPATTLSATGTYNLTFNSASTAYLSQDNTGITGLAVNALNFGGSNTGAITLAPNGSGGSISFVTSGTTTPTITDTSAANVSDSIGYTATNALTVTNTGGATLTLSGALTNTGGITFDGTGGSDHTDIVSLGGTDVTGSGAITLNGGVLLTGVNRQLSNNSSTTGAGGAITLAGGELASTGAVGTSNFIIVNAVTVTGAVQFGDSNHASVGASDVILNNGTSLNAGSATTTSGTYTLQTGTSGITFSANSGVTLTNNALITGSNNVIYSSGNILINGSTINTYTGTTSVNSGATLTLNNPNSSHFAVSGSGLIINGGTVNQTTANQVITTSALTVKNGGTYAFTGSLAANTTQNTYTGGIVLGTVSGSDTATLSYALGTLTTGTTNAFLKGGSLTINTSTPIVINLSGGTIGDTYDLLSWTSSPSAITLGEFSATSGYTLSLNGDSLDALYTGAVASTNYYFTGGDGTSTFTDSANYATTAAGTTSQSGNALSSTSNVFLNATTAAHTPDTLNTSASINSLNFVTAGTSLAGSGTATLAATGTAGITDSASTAGQTETVAPAVVLGSNQSWAATANSTLNVTGAISGPQSLAVTGNGTYKFAGSNTFQGLTVGTGSDTPTLFLTNGTSGSATGTTTLRVNAGSTLAGNGTSSGTSFNVSGTSTSARANILVGLTSATDTTVGNIMTLKGSTGTSTIADTNLTYNLDAKSTVSNQLNVGATNIIFGTDATGSVKFTLNLENEPAIVANGSTYTLIAGTGLTSTSSGSSSGQYTGLTLGTTTGSVGMTETIITSSNLQLAFGSSIDNTYYGTNSYLVLYQSAGVDDIDVVVVPEPGTWAMMLGGLALLIYWQRRKRA